MGLLNELKKGKECGKRLGSNHSALKMKKEGKELLPSVVKAAKKVYK